MVGFCKGLEGFPVALSALLFILSFVEGDLVQPPVVQCYVCSWQQPTTNLSLTDTCTHYNFQPEYASTVNCTTGGCEAVTYRNSKNEAILHFRRNCLNLNSRTGKGQEDICYVSEAKTEHVHVCECHSNLCNSAKPTTFVNSNFHPLITIITLVVSGHVGQCLK